MESRQALTFEAALFRIEKHTAERNKGNDGVLWNAIHRVAAVCDGIGSKVKNAGSRDLQTFEDALNLKGSAVSAFYELAGTGSSTIVAMQFPEYFGEQAWHIHAGDSIAYRLSNGVLQQITEPEHSQWAMVEPYVSEAYRRVLTPTDAGRLFPEMGPQSREGVTLEILKILEALDKVPLSPVKRNHIADTVLNELTSKYNRGELTPSTLLAIKRALGRTLTFSLELLVAEEDTEGNLLSNQEQLSASRSMLRDVVGEGTEVDVLPGDRFLLCSDGISDVLYPEEICRILTHTKTAFSAAEAVVARAELNRHIKQDDRSAIVIDVA